MTTVNVNAVYAGGHDGGHDGWGHNGMTMTTIMDMAQSQPRLRPRR